MKKKTSTSESLNGWANALVFAGVVFLILAFFGWIFSADSVSTEVGMGVLFIFASPVMRGLAILVQNAEEQIDERFEVKLRNADDE